MKKLRVKRGVKAIKFPDLYTFARAYSSMLGGMNIQCTDMISGRKFMFQELYNEIKTQMISTNAQKREWAASTLKFFRL